MNEEEEKLREMQRVMREKRREKVLSRISEASSNKEKDDDPDIKLESNISHRNSKEGSNTAKLTSIERYRLLKNI